MGVVQAKENSLYEMNDDDGMKEFITASNKT